MAAPNVQWILSQKGKEKLVIDDYTFICNGKGKTISAPNVRYWSCQANGCAVKAKTSGNQLASYDTTLRSILDKHAPYKAVRLRSSGFSVCWYNAECRLVKAKTRRLKRIYRRTRTPVSLISWRQQLALQRTVLERCFILYWTDTINDNKHYSRALWSQVSKNKIFTSKQRG
jgi:FLYWCH zinc finger domain